MILSRTFNASYIKAHYFIMFQLGYLQLSVILLPNIMYPMSPGLKDFLKVFKLCEQYASLLWKTWRGIMVSGLPSPQYPTWSVKLRFQCSQQSFPHEIPCITTRLRVFR
jgi:hypothetical protein